MEFKDILAISGMPGLYRYVAQSTRGIIVESLVDGKRMNAAGTSRVSALSEISMFTEGDDIALAEVFTRMYTHTGGKEGLSHKESPERIKAYFAEVLPEYDRDRVHGVGHEEGAFVVQHPRRRRPHGVQAARRGGRSYGRGASKGRIAAAIRSVRPTFDGRRAVLLMWPKKRNTGPNHSRFGPVPHRLAGYSMPFIVGICILPEGLPLVPIFGQPSTHITLSRKSLRPPLPPSEVV